MGVDTVVHGLEDKTFQCHRCLSTCLIITCREANLTCQEIQHLVAARVTTINIFLQSLRMLTLPPTEQSSTFLEAIQSLVPYWTPISQDNVVYATTEEASSGKHHRCEC